MNVVVVGVIADSLGAASTLVTVGHHSAARNFDVKREYLSTPSTEYRSVQRPAIAVDLNHQQPLGRVAYLERTATRLYAVCEIDGSSLGDGPWYFSPEILHHDGKDIELRALAVTRSPASVALGPLNAFPGTLADAAGQIVYQDGPDGQLIRRAREYDRGHKRGAPLEIREAAPAASAMADEEPWSPRQASPAIEYRSATRVDVNPRRRLIELLAVPYGVEALVAVKGRMIAESFTNTAFANVDKQTGRILATRDHDPTRLFGKVTHLEPFHHEGLLATIQASNTELGRESVELARDQVLDASIGFGVPPGGEVWEGRNRRRVTRALLREVSLVPEPAYPTRVLDVREARATH